MGFGVIETEETTLIVNGTVAISVTSAICADSACTTHSNQTVYSQNDEVTISHAPVVSGAKLIEVTAITANLGNGTVKDAMNYLVSQTANSDGSLTTKIKLLDTSNSGIIVTFYMSNRLTTGRLLVDTSSLNYTKSSYTFEVIASGNNKADACEGSVLKCNIGALIAVIVSCAVVLLIGLGLLFWYCRRKMANAKAKEKSSEAEVGKDDVSSATIRPPLPNKV